MNKFFALLLSCITSVSFAQTGGVGIGNTSPTELLEIGNGNGTTYPQPGLLLHAGGNTLGSGGILKYRQSTPNRGMNIRHGIDSNSTTAEGLYFEAVTSGTANGTPVLMLDQNAQRVGIGTRKPVAQLDIVLPNTQSLVTSDQSIGLRVGAQYIANRSQPIGIELVSTSGNGDYGSAAIMNTGGNGNSNLSFWVQTGYAVRQEAMRILSTGQMQMKPDLISTFSMGYETGLGAVVSSDKVFRINNNYTRTVGQNTTVYNNYFAMRNLPLRSGTIGGIGINTDTPTSTLHLNGSFALPVRTVTASSSVFSNDYTIVVTGSGVTLTLPDANNAPGRIYVIRVDGGSATIVSSSIVGNTSLNGAPGATCVTYQSTGTKWISIGQF